MAIYSTIEQQTFTPGNKKRAPDPLNEVVIQTTLKHTK